MYKPKPLPPSVELNSQDIWQSLNSASRSLAELKGESKTILNIDILINTLSLQESKESSEIENIVTTQDDLFKYQGEVDIKNLAAKEVKLYSQALLHGYNLIKQQGLFISNHILEIQEIIEPNKPGLRKLPGTELKNSRGETIYVPPQNYQEIVELMSNLDKYINLPEMHEVDPLIKMAIVHHQFESVHPFYDGNGRTGRIINILYLVYLELLDIPVLYLSRYINRNKADYYRLLQEVRDKQNWEQWIIWMLKGVNLTAQHTVKIIRRIKQIMEHFTSEIQTKAEAIYSKELLELLFKYPYTKVKFIEEGLNIHRHTATKYLNVLVELGLLTMHKSGKSNYYVNHQLCDLLSDTDKIS